MALRCRYCGSTISRGTRSPHMTAALSSAALLLYVPANVFPLLRLDMYGATSESTVWQGCVKLYEGGDLVIALIVFAASILIPLLKLMSLFFLSYCAQRRVSRWKLARAWVYRIIDVVSRWAMLDVFVLAILVSLVKLQRLASIVPGKGALAFAAVVILTLLAEQSFDPRSIWDLDLLDSESKTK